MKKLAFFDTKPYDKLWFDRANTGYEIVYFETKLNARTARLAAGCDAVCAFVNDTVDAAAIDVLYENGVKVLALRCAGYNNVDRKAAYGKLVIVRVPAYSPHAVAEHAMALLLCLNRKVHKAYIRTRDFNFSLVGLGGMDLHGKTVGVIGTGKIGRVFIDICRGFGMQVLAYDPYPAADSGLDYVSLDELLERSDVISLHCPLTKENRHLLDRAAFAKMKKGVFLINTSRGGLVDSEALLEALNSGAVRGAGLDVYEEEADLFFEDNSDTPVLDETLSLLVSRPNVIMTSHQAFLTEEALADIARTTFMNLDEYFSDAPVLTNEICYHCDRRKSDPDCLRNRRERCWKPITD